MEEHKLPYVPSNDHAFSERSSGRDTSASYSDYFSETEDEAAARSKEQKAADKPEELDADERTVFLGDPLSAVHLDPREPSSSKLRNLGIAATGIGMVLIVALWLAMFLYSTAIDPPGSRPAVILASYSKQNISWIREVPKSWQVFRMCNDCGRAPTTDRYGTTYPVPTTNGREATAYLTFIVRNYHILPPYMLFLHGHDTDWHQPERAIDILRAVNFTAVDEQLYIPLGCTLVDCSSLEDHILANGPEEYADATPPRRLFRIAPAFWKLIFGEILHETPPEKFNAVNGAQFVVSAAAIRRRKLEDWVALRRLLLDRDMDVLDQLLRDISIEEWGLGANATKGTVFGADTKIDPRAIGIMFEGAWHRIFGAHAVYCPSTETCRKVFFSGVIDCPLYHQNVSETGNLGLVERKKVTHEPCTIDKAAMKHILRENTARLRIS